MWPERLRQLLARQPCPRLRLHLTGGTTFEITDPDQAVITPSTVELLLAGAASGSQEVVVTLLHIVWVDVFEPA